MRSGRLRHRITLRQLAGGSPRQAPNGERLDAFADVATVRAYIRPISGKEFRAGQQVQAQISTEIEIRYRADVVAGMQAVHGADVYHIEAAIDPEKRGRKLLLQCSSGVVNG
jgi:SPP1 family predicted phage head-tail adaptor